MSNTNQSNLQSVDWSKLPPPGDDGTADHLLGMDWPDIPLPSTDGGAVNVSRLSDLSIMFAYPMTGRPDVELPEGWDLTPGARGCTPQACSFRNAHGELLSAGMDHVFGLSVQDTDYQTEAAERLHLPYPLLSDSLGKLQSVLKPPMFKIAGLTLFQRITYAVRNGKIEKIWFPAFPPDQNVDAVLSWLKEPTVSDD